MNTSLLKKVTILYIVGIAVGLAMFKSPSFSAAFRQEHGKELDRYFAIVKSEPFKLYEQRPHLYPLEGKLLEDAEWAEHFREMEAFEHEEHRIALYVRFFNVLNSTVFILYLVALIGKPLTGYLDVQIQAIRQKLGDAAAARAKAGERKTAARARLDAWPQEEAALNAETGAEIAHRVEEIATSEAEARATLERQVAERKQAELNVLARTIRKELVSEAVARLEERYKAEVSADELSRSVDQFTVLIERLT
jgi:F0F1-type ATP synthase membrane subunit b/b'